LAGKSDLERMLDIWEAIFAEHPHDVLAFRLHHFNAFWLGRPATMQAEVEASSGTGAMNCRAGA
jgi:hypothetical protein